jgi:hypothetical protein
MNERKAREGGRSASRLVVAGSVGRFLPASKFDDLDAVRR